MPRIARKQSASSIYHVMNRGEGRQIIFEDDSDRAFFMRRLDDLLAEMHGTLLAWCLLDNHFHLLVSASLDNLKKLMHRLQTGYAGYFNRVHRHDGALFGGRFESEPVDTEKYLMTVVRYIHENPVKARLGGLGYRWSSYREYCSGAEHVNPEFVLGVFGGVGQFRSFHAADHGDERCLDMAGLPRRGIGDEEARAIADNLLGEGVATSLGGRARAERDQGLATLKEAGLSVRQIQRLTGISLGTISRAGRG
ncbi:MAG: transposase [Atopobiaceae bacterium]|nr:transposase [Atopobiaceae bacterium]MBR3312679.1 transposase [Atopobiaceae bacterium]